MKLSDISGGTVTIAQLCTRLNVQLDRAGRSWLNNAVRVEYKRRHGCYPPKVPVDLGEGRKPAMANAYSERDIGWLTPLIRQAMSDERKAQTAANKAREAAKVDRAELLERFRAQLRAKRERLAEARRQAKQKIETKITNLAIRLEATILALADQQQITAKQQRTIEELTRKVGYLTDRQYGFIRQRSAN